MAKQSSLSDYPKGLSRIVGMGLSSMVLSLDDFTVLKHPLSEYHYGAVETERRIYERLGHHPRIVKYIRRYGDGIVLERLQYQLREHLQNFRSAGELPPIDNIFR
ncbi:hypothetical protein LOZ07_000597 [Ophidiomyces ophidiicola]|nr:hypothetical protein LOZ59_001531 [Ophidiomyces ophidiicola]KAI2014181.1 hypothetical protein LOZ49_001547 [Ophidiomyces ophidiicola]KAI2025984.1 hypothetical protein LOZ48_005261 [Ophidiomyces ophidiicola]KAI2128039.1 hypothetical protein LOZ31_002234 [Ophidiomyces ophidiicola]KAI2147870.1 hypothetical protein LOZ27_002238 [Ophidiomyces ophidiicola]